MSRVLLYCSIVVVSLAPGTCVWLCQPHAEAKMPTTASLFVPSGAMSYYIPERIGCSARTAGSSYGYYWVRGWEAEGMWYTRDQRGNAIRVFPAEIRRDTV